MRTLLSHPQTRIVANARLPVCKLHVKVQGSTFVLAALAAFNRKAVTLAKPG